MNGGKYLLDTNFILGLLKADPLVFAQLSSRQLHVGECSYSAITRMELLGFHNITRDEETLIKQKLDRLTYLPLTENIENIVIALRQSRKIKLPDAIIAATALFNDLELLTLDQHLLSVMSTAQQSK
jgi:hypothetical protein